MRHAGGLPLLRDILWSSTESCGGRTPCCKNLAEWSLCHAGGQGPEKEQIVARIVQTFVVLRETQEIFLTFFICCMLLGQFPDFRCLWPLFQYRCLTEEMVQSSPSCHSRTHCLHLRYHLTLYFESLYFYILCFNQYILIMHSNGSVVTFSCTYNEFRSCASPTHVALSFSFFKAFVIF